MGAKHAEATGRGQRNKPFEASANWIRIEETSEGLDVFVDTSTVGKLHGDIALAGPTGEAVITVDVEVTPSPPQPPPPATKPPPSRDELPTDNRATASTPTRTRQPDGPPARPAPPPAPDSPSPQPAAPAHARTVTPHDTGVPTSLVPGHTATPPVTPDPKRSKILHVLWALIPVLSFGILVPVPLVHAAVRLHDRRFWLITTAYVTVWLPLFIISAAESSVAPVLLFLLGVVATAHALWLRRRVFAEPSASPPPTEP